MGIKDTLDVLWVLKKCVWCGFHIEPDDLGHTYDPEQSREVFFEHRFGCPDKDPLASPA